MALLRDTSSAMFKTVSVLYRNILSTPPSQHFIMKNLLCLLKQTKTLKKNTVNNHTPTTFILQLFCCICFISSSISLPYFLMHFVESPWLQRFDTMSSLTLEGLGHTQWSNTINELLWPSHLLCVFQDVFHMVVEVPRWSNAKMEVCFTFASQM